MHQGNWKCSKCGGAITELPFVPRSEAGLTCRSCFMASKNGGQSSGQSAGQANDAPPMDSSDEMPPFDPTEGSVATEPAPPPPDSLDGAVPVSGERKMFKGDWQCATCGGAISQLPFEPRDVTNLKCIDCFKKG